MKNIYNKIVEIQSAGKNAALCLITNTKGSTPRKAGTKMLVYENGEIWGTIGGGTLEQECIKKAIEVIKNKQPFLLKNKLANDFEMSCGGETEIYIEPIYPTAELFIFGAGHVGSQVANFAHTVGFPVTIIDERENILNHFDKAKFRCINKMHNEAFKEIYLNKSSFIVITTHMHKYDQAIVSWAIKQPFAYLGMIGSTRKVEKTREVLISEGNSIEAINAIDMPMGLPIVCQTPEEIAISIIAKLVDTRGKLLKNE